MGTVVRGKIIRDDLALWDGKTSTATRVDATGGTITGLQVNDFIDVLSVFGSGTARTVGSLGSAAAHIGSSNATLMLNPGTWTIDDDLTLAANLTVYLPSGAVLAVSSGKTLTISGRLIREHDTWKSGSGDVVVSLDSVMFYGQTATESSLSIIPSDYTYEEPDIRRYGALVATADNSTAIQNAINVAATDDLELVIPPGRWRHASTLYFYYDAGNNAGYPSGAREDGRQIIRGHGAPESLNFQNTEYKGSILEYTAGSGVGLDFYDSSGTESKAIIARDFGVYANTSGFPVQVHRVPRNTIFSNLFIGNNGSGGCLSVEDVWAATFSHIWLYGDGTGVGLKFDPTESAGMVWWEMITAENVAIAFDLGAAYDGTRTAFASDHVFSFCQSTGNAIGFRIRAGMATVALDRCWVEGVSGSAGRCIQISDMAGWMDGSGAAYQNLGLIEINGGHYSWTDTTSGLIGIEIGDDTATDTTDGVGNVIIRNTLFGQVAANTDAIRIHNSANAGYRIIENPVFHNNSGQYIVIDLEAQYGPITVRNPNPDGVTPPNIVEDTSSADASHWCAEVEGIIPELAPSGTYDYTNSPVMPRHLGIRTAGGTVTITPPASPIEHEFTLYKFGGGSTLTFSYDSTNNINGASASYTTIETYFAIEGAFDSFSRWMLAPGKPTSGYGSMTISGNGTATTVSAGDTYYQVVAGWVTGSVSNMTFSTNELVATNAGTYLVNFAGSMTGATNDTFTFAIAKDDTPIAATAIQRKTSSADVGAFALTAIVTLAATETLQVYGKNNGDTDDFTITDGAFTAVRVA